MVPPTPGRPRPSRRRRRRRDLVGLLAVLLVAALVVALVVHERRGDATAEGVSASSTAPGFDAAALWEGSGTDPVWRSGGSTTGTSLRLDLGSGATVDRLVLRTPDTADRMTQGHLLFSDGSALLVTPAVGETTTTFTPRAVEGAVLVVDAVADGAAAVELAGLRVDAGGDDAEGVAPKGDVTGDASVDPSSTGSGDAASLVGVTDDQLGRAQGWTSAADDPEPSVTLTWQRSLELSSVRLYGPAGTGGGSRAGRLEFSDGSQVPFAAVLDAGDAPTTVAFMPRVADSVRVVLEAANDGDSPGLRAVQVRARGSAPPVVAGEEGGSGQAEQTGTSSPSEAVTCDASTAVGDVPTDPSQRRLVCPAPGTSGGARPTVVVAAPPGTTLTATASTAASTSAGDRAGAVVATGTSDASGRAVLDVQQPLPAGPVNLRVDGAGDPLWVQLVVVGSTAAERDSFAPPGLSLVYEDDFDTPLSLSETGRDTRYTAQRPTATGGEGYGEAAFGAPALRADTAQTGGGLLHLRTEDAPGGAVGAMVSSATYGGAGFSAQYAYFETRALGAPGLGTWPAFWMLTTPGLAEVDRDNAEVDAFEMYGHDTTGLCNSTHDYQGGQQVDKQIDCNPMETGADWAMQWHTYGARVLPDVVVFTTDGVETARIPRPKAADEPFFFMLTLARGGGWPVDLSGTGQVADMYVDWVRVYT